MENKSLRFIVSFALAFFIFCSILSVTSMAIAGGYDGLWVNKTDPSLAVPLIRHSGGIILVVFLTLDSGGWGAFYGPISGSSAT